jgi:hypothetical protein
MIASSGFLPEYFESMRKHEGSAKFGCSGCAKGLCATLHLMILLLRSV